MCQEVHRVYAREWWGEQANWTYIQRQFGEFLFSQTQICTIWKCIHKCSKSTFNLWPMKWNDGKRWGEEYLQWAAEYAACNKLAKPATKTTLLTIVLLILKCWKCWWFSFNFFIQYFLAHKWTRRTPISCSVKLLSIKVTLRSWSALQCI